MRTGPAVTCRVAARAAAAALAAVLLASSPARGAGSHTSPLQLPPPPVPAPPAATSSAPPPPALVSRLDRLQQFPQTRPGGTVGLAVVDGAGQTLAVRRARRGLLPASVTKLVTAAAALRLYGLEHRFVTRVHATAPPDADGVVDGDLVLVGGGDPVLATPTFVKKVDTLRPATPLAGLAGRVARSGIRRVTGDIIGDSSVLAHEPLAAGWRADYLTGLDARRSSGLTVDAGLRIFRRSGSLHAAAARNPAARAASELRRLLERRDVQIVGGVGTVRRASTAGTEIARIASPPMSQLLRHMTQFSDNHLADGIFRMLGAAIGDPTWDGGGLAARRALADADVSWSRLRLVDGSGLSRRDRLTAGALVELLRVMADGPQRAQWLRLQAVAGRSGTMRVRLAGTPAEGRVFAKTGTLRDVRALAGTIPGRRGRDHHFAVLANDLEDYGDVAAARRLADVLALALVVAQDGCAGPISAADRAERRPPEHLLCGPPTRTKERRDSRR